MMVHICHDTDPQWLLERQKRVTSSEINVWLGTAPSFYSDTKAGLIERKRTGLEKDFDDKTTRRLAHGREREKNNLRMLGLLTGYPVVSYNWFITHERWPAIGATLDGLLFPSMGIDPDLSLTSAQAHCAYQNARLELLGGTVLVEMKNTDGGHRYKDKDGPHAGLRAWLDYCPDYHREQVQTALTLTGLDHCILCGSLGGDDMAYWTIERDPMWESILDEVNAEALEVLAP